MATNGEHLVPGLGDKQAAVLNNEHARQLEHKRHLEELGFPEEVEPEFVRHAPVSYDDPSNPAPSRVVNQAGQDLGDPNKEDSDHFKKFKYTPEKPIAKEAFLDFIQKQPNKEVSKALVITPKKLTPSEFFASEGKPDDSVDAAAAGFTLPAGVGGVGTQSVLQIQADQAARAADPSMTTDVAGTRDKFDALFGADPTGAGIGSTDVGMTGDPGAGTKAGGFKPATGTEDILNADFDTRFNEAQTRQIVKEAMNDFKIEKDTKEDDIFQRAIKDATPEERKWFQELDKNSSTYARDFGTLPKMGENYHAIPISDKPSTYKVPKTLSVTGVPSLNPLDYMDRFSMQEYKKLDPLTSEDEKRLQELIGIGDMMDRGGPSGKEQRELESLLKRQEDQDWRTPTDMKTYFDNLLGENERPSVVMVNTYARQFMQPTKAFMRDMDVWQRYFGPARQDYRGAVNWFQEADPLSTKEYEKLLNSPLDVETYITITDPKAPKVSIADKILEAVPDQFKDGVAALAVKLDNPVKALAPLANIKKPYEALKNLTESALNPKTESDKTLSNIAGLSQRQFQTAQDIATKDPKKIRDIQSQVGSAMAGTGQTQTTEERAKDVLTSPTFVQRRTKEAGLERAGTPSSAETLRGDYVPPKKEDAPPPTPTPPVRNVQDDLQSTSAMRPPSGNVGTGGGSTSAGRTLSIDQGLVGGKQFGTISGPGTSDYRIEVKPKNYPKAKPGDVITLSKMNDYKAWIQKQDGFDYGGFAPGTSKRRTSLQPGLGAGQQQEPAPPEQPSGQGQQQARDKSVGQRATTPPPKQSKDRYGDIKQRDLQTSPEPPNLKPNLKSMQKYNAWLAKAEEEGAMAKVQLDRVSDLADMMHNALGDHDELPGWIQNKISDSLHNLEASFTHLAYDAKQEMELSKSKETFKDFLAKAPQGRGYLQGGEDIFLQKWIGAVALAFPLVAKGLLKLIPKLFTKTVGTGKDAVTKLSPLKTAATVGTAAFLYDTASDPDWSPFEGLKGKEFEEADKEWKTLDPQTKKDTLGTFNNEVAKEMDKQPQDIQDAAFENYKNLSEGNTTVGEVLSASQAADVGSSTRTNYGYDSGEEWKATSPAIRSTIKDPKYRSASSTMPVYDTSPEAEARVRAGGKESIIGYKTNGGATTKLKTPVSSMGELNSLLAS